MTAGHILLAVLIGFVAATAAALGMAGCRRRHPCRSWGRSRSWCLELFVAFLQAYLFTFLTSLFIGQLVVHEHEHGHEGEGGHHDEAHWVGGGGDLGHEPENPTEGGARAVRAPPPADGLAQTTTTHAVRAGVTPGILPR